MEIKKPNPTSISIFIAGLFLPLAALAACAGSTPVATPTATAAPTAQTPDPQALDPQAPDPTVKPAGAAVPVVIVGGTAFDIELAETPEKRTQGLSGRDSLAPGAGMLFIHDDEKRYTFWMKDMRFPLDMLWIDADCTVAGISAQVPPPEPGQSDRSLPLFSPETPVLHVLEINAGAAAAAGIS
ncbi:MAG: DUF192 domain-containing protein, partial [Chloroflexi bacterium]|nr:DUF192 domain-containing protein [Chloroflexota bacterium]